MKIYKHYQHASITMIEDGPFLEALRKFKPKIIIETGTHLGTGSTRMLASLRPEKLYTIECSYVNYMQAKKNLEQFPFVECIHGLSVGVDESKKFMESNSSIFLDNVFVDDENPIEFYTNEIMGMLNGGEQKQDMRENVLEDILPTIADQNPLILLDSAGGIGLLEFLKVKEIMGDRPYILVLDDTHHVKHHRSKLLVEKEQNFKIVYNDDRHGRLIATYNQANDVIIFEDPKPPIVIILGRFGDIYMVAKKLKKPSIIACLEEFSAILDELFPEHTCIKMKDIPRNNPWVAANILSMSHPFHTIIICQQDGTPLENMKEFRTFQTYQEYYAVIQ